MDEQVRNIIIRELSLPEEKADEVITTLGGLILENVILDVTNTLSDEKVIEFEKIMAVGTIEQMTIFLAENIDHFDQFVEKSAHEVIEHYKNG